ncbi:hypothetical protein HispidOSU_026759 [Sigmodon hispidus]
MHTTLWNRAGDTRIRGPAGVCEESGDGRQLAFWWIGLAFFLRSKIIIIPDATRKQHEVRKGKEMIDLCLWQSLPSAGRGWQELHYKAIGTWSGEVMWSRIGDSMEDEKWQVSL